jgi:predicted nucleic-acid-binding protein
MIAFDTNLLVRYVTGDDEAQCRKVDALVRSHSGEERIYVSDVALVELEWVLVSVYGFTRQRIADALGKILRVSQFRFSDRESLLSSLAKYRSHSRDFSDCVIGEHGRLANARTYTFDKALNSDSNFVVI